MKIQIEIRPDASAMEQEIASMLAWVPQRDRASIVRLALGLGLKSMFSGTAQPSPTSDRPVRPEVKTPSRNVVEETDDHMGASAHPEGRPSHDGDVSRSKTKKDRTPPRVSGQSTASQIVGMFRND